MNADPSQIMDADPQQKTTQIPRVWDPFNCFMNADPTLIKNLAPIVRQTSTKMHADPSQIMDADPHQKTTQISLSSDPYGTFMNADPKNIENLVLLNPSLVSGGPTVSSPYADPSLKQGADPYGRKNSITAWVYADPQN